MRQGIIFGIVLIALSYLGVTTLNNTMVIDSSLKILNIITEGEEIYSSPLDSYESYVLWYIEDESGEIHLLFDQDIIDYYDLDMTLAEIRNPDLIDYDKIIAKSGEDTEINMLLVDEGTVTMYEANCPNKLCVKTGSISEVNQQIVCIPHKMVVSITGDSHVDA